MHPFLDTKSLTDEQIIERLGRAHTYLNSQTALGHTPTVQSIQEVIDALEIERRTRMNRITEEEISKKYPNLNSPIDLGKLED